ncbi:MAG: hypothetical protein H6738_08740 [Alphaproteobacteria bacterium]|nr:hypothetical protein [Alphaproteobacteria bacterium]MCB9696847.1 hypothetical protein [Alphaproteobacteria bacterium]
MRSSDETKLRVEKVLLEGIEHAVAKVSADQDPETWARAAADLGLAYRAITHYDDAPIGIGTSAPARKA